MEVVYKLMGFRAANPFKPFKRPQGAALFNLSSEATLFFLSSEANPFYPFKRSDPSNNQ